MKSTLAVRDPLLSSPNSLSVICGKCNRKMNNNYHYELGECGSASGYLCPKCYKNISTSPNYTRYVFDPKRHTKTPLKPTCPFCTIV